MYKGIYIAASGAILKNAELSLTARNIANASTPGYKKERTSFSSYLLPSSENISNPERVMVEKGKTLTDFSAGEFIKTGNPLDVAIEGDGFFVLEGKKYTRRGDFRLDEEGNLLNTEGFKVMGVDDTPLQLPQGRMEIGPGGDIMVNGTTAGRLKIVDFPQPYKLIQAGDATYLAPAESKPVESSSRVSSGVIEGSNVNLIKEMVGMIRITREFETYQKMIQAFDSATSKALNEIGRI
ncbi:Flagellar basal-body rod protein FlgF [hydrothermal vent metagenome]|uniref:Flagellar basal-body rod protein FlgF n=1 Tax=hydrothermal vent metagenome TaxID=652676 RepID=A0A3B1CJE4_9ZZZZ